VTKSREVVERGGRRVTYPTEAFLQACPANLSRNFRIRVTFGLSYGLQNEVTSSIPQVMKDYLELRIAEEGYESCCLNLHVFTHFTIYFRSDVTVG
jgi:hypothetical protein